MKKQGDGVLHFLGGSEPLPTPNSASFGTLDWVLRNELMRTHTTLHILYGTVFRDYGAKVTGGDMDPLKGRMISLAPPATSSRCGASRRAGVNLKPCVGSWYVILKAQSISRSSSDARYGENSSA